MNSTKGVVGGALALVLASGGFAFAANSGSDDGSNVGDLSPASSTSEMLSPSTSTSTIVIDVPVSPASGDDNSGDDNSPIPQALTSPAPGTGASAATQPAQPSHATTSRSSENDPSDDPSDDPSGGSDDDKSGPGDNSGPGSDDSGSGGGSSGHGGEDDD